MPAMPVSEARLVMWHESAHIVVFHRYGGGVRPHGDEWTSLLVSAGLPASVRISDHTHGLPSTAESSVTSRRFVYRCPVCHAVACARRRMPHWRCVACMENALVGNMIVNQCGPLTSAPFVRPMPPAFSAMNILWCSAGGMDRPSTACRTSNNAGAFRSRMGFLPMLGNRSASSRTILASAVIFAHELLCLVCHSRAMTSKVFWPATVPAAFSALRVSAGSILQAMSFRAWSRFSRAPSIYRSVFLSWRPASGTSGSIPRLSSFSLPLYRYFNRHHFPPLGVTSRNSPPVSNSFNGFASALAFLMATSVSGMWG